MHEPTRSWRERARRGGRGGGVVGAEPRPFTGSWGPALGSGGNVSVDLGPNGGAITDDSGAGSLRQAVADVLAGGTITFSAGLSGQTITLTTGEITLGKNLTIDGSSLASPVVLSGNDDSRIFNVLGGTTVDLTALAFTLGRADEADDGSDASIA